ncbi:MAG: trypsin-like peptidase domain-containing protein [Proteobacteria bacterium]|nr:trypsin-like peptidase domain-containing protein [Pseudomonadota bacterium]
MKHAYALIATIGFMFPAIAMSAPSPDQVFSKLSESVYVVEAYGSDGKVVTQGSGLVTAPNQIATNCHVVEAAKTIGIRREGKKFTAELSAADKTRDLCLLRINGKIGPTLQVRESNSLKVGQRVYAIGAPLGLELTFSEGIISSLRKADGGFMVQTTTPISPGSSGGGLFDENGMLIGVTTLQTTKGQNLNFAVPAEWISSVSARHARASQLTEELEQLTKRAFNLQEAQQWRELQQHADAWTKRYPSHLGGWHWLARAYERQDQKKEAIANYRRAVNSDMYSSNDGMMLWMSYIFMAQLQREAGQDADCAGSYAEAMLLLPEKDIAGNMFHCFRRAGQFDRGLEIYRQISLKHPNSEVGWEGLGGAYLNMKKPRDARSAFAKLVTLNPKHEGGWVGFMIASIMDKDQEGTLMAARKLDAIAPGVADQILKDISKSQ